MKKFLLRVARKIGILKSLNLLIKTKVNNKTVVVPVLGTVGLTNIQISEPWMIQLLKIIFRLRPNGAYLDVGVNIGQTLIKVKSVNSQVVYLGFEPNPVCIYYVKELINVNRYENVTLFPVGISDADTIYELSSFEDTDIDSSASILKDFRSDAKEQRKQFVPCFKAETIIERFKLPSVGIIKIDVEGAEKEVLQGLEKLIKENQPLIQIEVLPVYNKENAERLQRQNAIEKLIKKLNYSIFRIESIDNDCQLKNIESIGVHDNLDWCEYLLVPDPEKKWLLQL